MPLTDVRIRSLKPADKPHKYSDGGGLFLFIPPSGSRLWNKFAALLAAICARIGSRKAKVKAGFLPPFFVSPVVVWGMAESACAGA